MHLTTATLGAILVAINSVTAIHETVSDDTQNEVLPHNTHPDSGVKNLVEIIKQASQQRPIDRKDTEPSPDQETLEAFKVLVDQIIGNSPFNSPEAPENPSSTENSSENDMSLITTQNAQPTKITAQEEATSDIESVPSANPLVVGNPVKIEEFENKETEQEKEIKVEILPNLSNYVNSEIEATQVPTGANVEESGSESLKEDDFEKKQVSNLPVPAEDISYKVNNADDDEKPLVIEFTPVKNFEDDTNEAEKKNVIANLSNEINAAVSDLTQSVQEGHPEDVQIPSAEATTVGDAVTNVPEISSEASSISNLGNIPGEFSQTKLNDIVNQDEKTVSTRNKLSSMSKVELKNYRSELGQEKEYLKLYRDNLKKQIDDVESKILAAHGLERTTLKLEKDQLKQQLFDVKLVLVEKKIQKLNADHVAKPDIPSAKHFQEQSDTLIKMLELLKETLSKLKISQPEKEKSLFTIEKLKQGLVTKKKNVKLILGV